MDRHVPAAEVDHAGAGGEMRGVKGSVSGHVRSPRMTQENKGAIPAWVSPRLSFYLRDCAGPALRRGGAPSVGRRLPARPLSRMSRDTTAARVRQSFCLSGCGSCAFGGRLPCALLHGPGKVTGSRERRQSDGRLRVKGSPFTLSNYSE